VQRLCNRGIYKPSNRGVYVLYWEYGRILDSCACLLQVLGVQTVFPALLASSPAQKERDELVITKLSDLDKIARVYQEVDTM
jgi:hypothetical protein